MWLNSPCARHPPRLVEKVSFNSRLLLASHPLQLVLPFVHSFTGQIYCIRIKWWILLFKKSSHGPQFVQSHIRPFALLCCCPVNRAQAVQHKLGFSCWGRKRGLKQQINKASASRSWRLHWKMASVLVKAMFLWFNGDNQFLPKLRYQNYLTWCCVQWWSL